MALWLSPVIPTKQPDSQMPTLTPCQSIPPLRAVIPGLREAVLRIRDLEGPPSEFHQEGVCARGLIPGPRGYAWVFIFKGRQCLSLWH